MLLKDPEVKRKRPNLTQLNRERSIDIRNQIQAYTASNPKHKASEIARAIGISEKTIRKHLKDLQEL